MSKHKDYDFAKLYLNFSQNCNPMTLNDEEIDEILNKIEHENPISAITEFLLDNMDGELIKKTKEIEASRFAESVEELLNYIEIVKGYKEMGDINISLSI